MSMTPDNWFNRFFSFGGFPFRRNHGNYFSDIFRDFDKIRREMELDFEESFTDIESKAPKDLVIRKMSFRNN